MTTIDTLLPARAHLAQPSARALAERALAGLSARVLQLLEWQENARQRRQLLALTDSALKDFGASRADAEREGGKPFWR